ncbi:hypothetical protein Vafri_3345 [Volvox africanus]|uniref:Uncharacterized protein n=2 Tax=Volvox africanus TaxID=51714 RepID=A0A8J4AS23_9CHLO|nr:hypothetical protein Vafri_3345 [Volvox africanus]GIL46331.1 hypothetical protein Vafri_3345 [Volvox africanus]
MSCAEATLRDDADTVQEFSFDGVYAGTVPERKEVVRSVKRQPKRRGLWHACFAQPLADEPVDTLPSRSTSSQLRLTARQLEYRRTGSPEAKHLPLSDIRNLQFKWIQAGGVRVSKVTVSLETSKEPVVIRGLKNPEDLVDAVRKRQLVVEHVSNVPDAGVAGRASAGGGARRAGGSDVPASSNKHMSPQALFADATGSPASAATSGCGGMTLLSAFARIPAQGFAGADSVAREIQLASPRSEVSSYSSSGSGDIADTASPNTSSSQKSEGVSLPALRSLPAVVGAAETLRAAQPPRQPSDSFAIPVKLALLDMATRSLPASPQPSQQSPNGFARPDPRTDTASPNTSSPQKSEGVSPPALRSLPAVVGAAETLRAAQPPRQPSDSFAIPVKLALLDMATRSLPASPQPSQQSPNGFGRPDTRTNGDSSSYPGGVVAQSGPPRPRLELQGSPPRTTGTMPEDYSVLASISGSAQAPPVLVATGGPPPVPEDLRVDKDNSTRISITSAVEGHHSLSGAVLRSDLDAPRPADSCKVLLSGSAFWPALAPELAVISDNRLPGRTEACLEVESFASQIGADLIRQLVDEALSAAGSGSCSSLTEKTRLPPALPKQQHRQYEGSHRVTRSSLAPPSQPHITGCSSSDTVPAGPNARSDGGCSSFESASSGAVVDGSSGNSPTLLPRAAPAADGKGSIVVSDLTHEPTNNALNQKSMSTLCVAATAATVSAFLTSAASAGLRNVTLAATPSLTNCVKATTGPAASGAPAPLSVLGLTAAAALTLVAAAAVTHLRTGSPLRPWGQDPYGNDASQANVHLAPLLVTRNNGTRNVKAEWSQTSWSTDRSALQNNKAAAESTSGSIGRICAAIALPWQQVTAVSPVLADRCEVGDGGELVSAVALVQSVASPRATSTAALAAESSWCGSIGAVGANPPAGASEGVNGVSAGNGENSEDAITSGAWGSQPTLADFDPEHGTQPGQPAATWSGMVARQQLDAEEDALPVMLFSDGPGGMPPLVRSGEEGTAIVLHQAELAVPLHVRVGGGSGGLQMPPVAGLRYEGELQPPSSSGRDGCIEDELESTVPRECTCVSQPQHLPHINSSASQLLCAGKAMEHAVAPLGNSPQRQKHELEPEEGATYKCTQPSPLLHAGAATAAAEDPAAAGSPAVVTTAGLNRRRQVLHLTESPVRVLYSVHAAFTGPPPEEPIGQPRDGRTMVPTRDAALLLPTCDSAVQTDAPKVECAVQTEAEMRDSMRSSDQSQDASSDGEGTSASRCGSRSDNPAHPRLADSACQFVTEAEGESVRTLGAAVNSEGSMGCPSPLQVGAQDMCVSSLEEADPQLVGLGMAAASVDGARYRPTQSLSAADGSLCTCSSPLPGNPCVPRSIADAATATSASSCRHCLALACDSQSKRVSGSTNDAVQLRLPCLLGGQQIAEPTVMPHNGTTASTEVQLAASRSSSIASVGFDSVMARMQGQLDVASTPAKDPSQQQRQLGNLDMVGLDDEEISLSHSSSRSQIPSPSFSATSGSIHRSASVGSGPYTRLTSTASSSDGLDTSARGNILWPEGSAGNSQHNRNRTNAAQFYAPSSLSVGQGDDLGTRAAKDRGPDVQQRLLAPEITRSTEPPMPAPYTLTYFTEPCGANSPSVSNAQEDVSSAIAEAASLPSAGSDTADDITWLLGPGIGHASDAAAAAGGLVASAPDSPRIPLPPPLARSINTSRGGVGSSHRSTAEAVGGAKEKARLAEGCYSRESSNGSSGVPPGSLAWLGHRQLAPSCSSAGCVGAQRPDKAKFPLDSNQLVTRLSAGVHSSVAAVNQRHGVHAGAIDAGTNGHCGDKVESSSSKRARPGPSCGPIAAALDVMDSNGNLPFVVGNDDHDRSCRGGDIAVSSSPQTRSSMPYSSGTSAASRSTMTSPELSDISSAAYAGHVYAYDSRCGHQASSGAHAEPGARMDGSTATTGDDLFHNPLYGATAKNSPVTSRPAPSQPPGEEGSCMGMSYSIRDSICCGDDGNDGGTSTCTSSPAQASASQPSVGTPSIGRRRTREESATSSYRYDSGGCDTDAVVEHSTNPNEAWRSWVAAAAIRCLASSGRVCSPVQMAAQSGSAHSRGTGLEAFSNIGVHIIQPCKRARTAAPKLQTPAGIAQKLSSPVLLRGLASPLMVLNPAYAQSAGGSSAFTSPQPSTGGGISTPCVDAMQIPAVRVGAGTVIQQVHAPTNALLRPQPQQQQTVGHQKAVGTRVMLGVFSSSRMGPHSARTLSIGGSPAVTSPPPATSDIAPAARVETATDGDCVDTETIDRVALARAQSPAGSTLVLQRQPSQQDKHQRVGDQQPIRTRVMLGVFSSSRMGPHSARTLSTGGSSVATTPPSRTGSIVPAACVKSMEIGARIQADTGAVTVSEVAGIEGNECEARLEEGFGSVEQRISEHITPACLDPDSGWSSVQGSPSSNHAAHATALLRQANDAVDFAREAVQRGDAEWLSRVTATLQAVQSALDALREF